MAKKKLKEEIKKPDFMVRTLAAATAFVRQNLRMCILALVVVVVLSLSGYGYALYERNREEKVQYLLFRAIQAFEVYSQTNKEEDLKKAEGLLQDVVGKKHGESQRIAKLYLAKTYYARGKQEEAKKAYQELAAESSSSIVKSLAEKALQQIEKK
jgi:predicted negative regulator of RcsB-dependent stress response